jgi:ribose transport system substrate-binding protein
MKNKILTIICILIVVFMWSTIVNAKQISVGFTVPHLRSEYWALEYEGVKERIAEYGGTVSGFNAENDVSKQIDACENFIQMGVDVIILNPIDSYGLIPAVKKANEAGIPVITVGGKVMEGDTITYIFEDHVKAGRNGAQYIVEQLNGKGKVAMFTYPFANWGLEFEEGALSVFDKYPEIEIVAKDGNAWRDGGPEGIVSAMENILLAHPDLNAVWSFADNPSYNAMKAVQQKKREDIIIVGFNGFDFVLKAIKEGSPFKGTSMQNFKEIGQLAGQVAIRIFEGKKVPELIEVPAIWVTKEDLDKLDLDKLWDKLTTEELEEKYGLADLD